jgi:polyisoprenoid-binding protein YceI
MSTTITTHEIIPAGTWSIDPSHSSIEFRVKHMGIATVKGTFREFQGSIVVGEEPEAATVTGAVDVASVDTRENDRDAHLRSPDFFDAENHPQATFAATTLRPTEGEGFELDGELTIRGVTKPVRLVGEVQGSGVDPWGNDRLALELTGQISRGDYGMTFNQVLGSGNLLVSDKVKLELQLETVKATD